MSVHRPGFYADRFFKFMSSTVFKKSSCEFNLSPDTALHSQTAGAVWGEPQMSDARLLSRLLPSRDGKIRYKKLTALLGAASCHARVNHPFDPRALLFFITCQTTSHTSTQCTTQFKASYYTAASQCIHCYTAVISLRFRFVVICVD